jgi:hypothetical protein
MLSSFLEDDRLSDSELDSLRQLLSGEKNGCQAVYNSADRTPMKFLS